MTLFHFGNCFALAYFPYFITYKCSGLSEYNAFWKCVQAGVTYLFVQLCKMLFLATFFPTWEGGIYDFIGEFMKASVDVADLIGLNLVMSRNAGKGEYKIMVAALGWATAELIMSRCIPLWVGARGIEFDWKYIQMSIDSNISLVHYIVASAQDLRPPLFPGQLDGTAGPSAGDGAAGPQHLGPVCRRCQRAFLGLASQTLTYLLSIPRFSEVNSIWKVVSASVSLSGTVCQYCAHLGASGPRFGFGAR
ncbi:BOS complex subunit TMEM147 isoform X1 [Bubalus kerabau]|uniref:BOS complex subunit TMEM147 isoform X1 n=1 Tax=Bubalus carabanensis TaxID=3119969 RepID=UPI00244EDEFB|nr:BOS complex subunit TMEM147 isoform X1 [Bubalus carabanensis]